MASHLKQLEEFDIHGASAATAWTEWLDSWHNYSLAIDMDADGTAEAKKVATLLHCIGPASRKVYSTFQWAVGEERTATNVLQKFQEYVRPLVNIPYERQRFFTRRQQSGESFDQYYTSLRKIGTRAEVHQRTVPGNYYVWHN